MGSFFNMRIMFDPFEKPCPTRTMDYSRQSLCSLTFKIPGGNWVAKLTAMSPHDSRRTIP
jgi:hypothetical protein